MRKHPGRSANTFLMHKALTGVFRYDGEHGQRVTTNDKDWEWRVSLTIADSHTKLNYSVGEIVYEKRKGWSGIPLEIVEVFCNLGSHINYAYLCKGAYGWNVSGVTYLKHGKARCRLLHRSKVTAMRNSMV